MTDGAPVARTLRDGVSKVETMRLDVVRDGIGDETGEADARADAAPDLC